MKGLEGMLIICDYVVVKCMIVSSSNDYTVVKHMIVQSSYDCVVVKNVLVGSLICKKGLILLGGIDPTWLVR